jgi:hypothetical protein
LETESSGLYDDDAVHLAGLVADGGGAVVDEALGAVAVEEDEVLGLVDDAIEPVDGGGGIFGGLAGLAVEDLEDGLDGLAVGVLLLPAGQLQGNVVHHADVAFVVGGDDAVADGGEGRAEGLLGGEELVGPGAEDVLRLAIGDGDVLQATPHEEADQQSGECGEQEQGDEGDADLGAPVADA